MREIDFINSHDGPSIPRDFLPPGIVDERSPNRISIDSIGGEALQYVQSLVATEAPLIASEALDYAKDCYLELCETGEVPCIDGEPMPQHVYQAHFMLAFQIEEIFALAESHGNDIEKFMQDGDTAFMAELKDSET